MIKDLNLITCQVLWFHFQGKMVKLPEEINFYFKYFRVKVKSGPWGLSLGLFSNFADSAGLIWF